jgi:hypothetical protein
MVLRQKNLLDAFRQAAPDGRKAAAPSSFSGSSGPFAPSKSPEEGHEPTGVPSASALGEFGEPGASAATLLASRRLRTAFVAVVLVGAGAYLAVKLSSKSARAADSSASADAGDAGHGALSGGLASGADLVEKNQAAARMGTAADKALMDPANKFTIQLIQYRDDEAGRKLAVETAAYLRKQAIPVVSPISLGKNVILVADAKPRTEDLAALLKHVKLMSGPPPQEKQTPFASALVVNNDKIVKRR